MRFTTSGGTSPSEVPLQDRWSVRSQQETAHWTDEVSAWRHFEDACASIPACVMSSVTFLSRSLMRVPIWSSLDSSCSEMLWNLCSSRCMVASIASVMSSAALHSVLDMVSPDTHTQPAQLHSNKPHTRLPGTVLPHRPVTPRLKNPKWVSFLWRWRWLP